MNKIKQIFFTSVFALLTMFAKAEDRVPDANDFMRSNGKIYVVMAVVVTIMVGLFLYLISLDRKISKLEKGKYK